MEKIIDKIEREELEEIILKFMTRKQLTISNLETVVENVKSYMEKNAVLNMSSL